MKKRSNLRKILLRTLKENNFKLNNIYIRQKPFKYQIASVSFRNNIIRINKKVVQSVPKYLIKYIITHELVHLKLKHPYHNKKFYSEMAKALPKKVDWYDKQLLKHCKVIMTVVL